MSEEQQNQQYNQGYPQQYSQQQYYQPQHQYNQYQQQGYAKHQQGQGQYPQQQMYGQQQYQQNQYGYGGRQYQQYYQNQGSYYQQELSQQQQYYPQQGGYNQPKRQYQNYKKYDQTFTQAPTLEELRAKYQPLSQVNLSSFNPEALINDEFVIMRSASLQHIHKATKYGVWTSTSRTNEKLNNIYEQCKSLKKDVYLLFTLVNSHAFQAVGKLVGPFDPTNSFLYWDQPHKWLGTFPISWIYIHEVPQDTINKQIAMNFPNQNNIIFTDQIDCTQIAQAQQGILILNCFKEFLSLENRFLQRFPELDEQEEILKNQRDNDPQFLQKQEEVQAIFLQNPFAFQAPSKPKKNNNRFMPSPDQMMLMQAQHFAQQQQYQQNPYAQQQQTQYNTYNPQYKQYRQDNQLRQYDQEEFKQQKIDERFFITQGKKQQQQQRKQLKIKKRDTKFDYQQDPNAVILQQQEDDSENSQNEQSEQTQEQQ